MKKEPVADNKLKPFTNIWVLIIAMVLGFQLFNYMFKSPLIFHPLLDWFPFFWFIIKFENPILNFV